MSEEKKTLPPVLSIVGMFTSEQEARAKADELRGQGQTEVHIFPPGGKGLMGNLWSVNIPGEFPIRKDPADARVCSYCHKRYASITDFYTCWNCESLECINCGQTRLAKEPMTPTYIGNCLHCGAEWGYKNLPPPTRLMIAGRHPFFKNMFNTGMSGPTRADVSLLGNEIDGLSSNITNVVSNLFRSLYFGVEHWIESIQKVSAYYKRQQIALRDMLARLQSITQLDAIKGLHDVQSPTFRRILNTADALQPAFQAVGNFLTGAFQYPEFVESIRQLSQSMLEVQKVDNGQMTKALHEIQAKIQGTADAPLKNLLDHIGKQTHEQNGPANSHFQPQQIEAMQRLANLTEIPGEGFDAKYITKLLQSIVLDRKLSRGTSELRNLTELSQFQSHIESCLMTQEFDTALDCLDAWSQSHTLNALTYGLWGICLSATLDEFEAQTKMQQALQLDPSLLDIQTNLAMSFTKTNDFELAANAYQTVIELAQTQAKPPSPIWHADLSTCLFAVGEIDLAAFHLQKAITIQKMPEFLQKEKLYQEIRV